MRIHLEKEIRVNLLLAVLSGLFLGFSFPPSPFYTFGYISLIPLLLLIDRLDNYKQVIRYSYLTFFVFHLISLYWVGGFTHGKDPYLLVAGAALLLAHPMFYWIPVLGYVFIRKRLNHFLALVAFPLLWIGYEYSHSLTDFSFPWISLGNSQAYDLVRIQIAEVTSVYGVSFLLLSFNIIAYWVLIQIGSRKITPFSKKAIFSYVALVLIYILPWLYGNRIMKSHNHYFSERPIKVGIIQPNIDPWEKWGEGWDSKWESYENQFSLLLNESSTFSDSLDLIVWPETAIPFYILLTQNREYRNRIQSFIEKKGTPVFSGIPHAVYYDSSSAPVTARRTQVKNLFVEYFNSAALFDSKEENEVVYKKVVLVPFAERVPFAETLTFLIEPLKWGVGISGWGKGEDTLVFVLGTKKGDSVRFSGMICYESIYPNYVRHFVSKGAEFLIIITNDSWWGKTSGAFQHAAFASFRAIENRRWIVRSANGGISGFVDPMGRMHQPTSMYTKAKLGMDIYPQRVKTFYVRYGDLFALVSLSGGGFIFVIAVIGKLKRKKSEKAKQSN